jgi:hypothetical protein
LDASDSIVFLSTLINKGKDRTGEVRERRNHERKRDHEKEIRK